MKETKILTSEEERERDACAAVGKMILMGALLDDQLSKILIEVLALEPSPLLLSVVSTLDTSRKIDILKAQTKHLPDGPWKEGLKEYLGPLERAIKYRNIAAHSIPVENGGRLVLTSYATAKLMRALDRKEKVVAKLEVEALRGECDRAENAHSIGQNALENFKRFAAQVRDIRRKKLGVSI